MISPLSRRRRGVFGIGWKGKTPLPVGHRNEGTKPMSRLDDNGRCGGKPMVKPGKGLSRADESTGTIGQALCLDQHGEIIETNRRDWRDILFRTMPPRLDDHHFRRHSL